MSPRILLNWFTSDSEGTDFLLPGADNSFMVIIHALDPFLGIDSSKSIEGVVTDHQCLSASHVDIALPLEGSGYLQVKDTNKSLQRMCYNYQ